MFIRHSNHLPSFSLLLQQCDIDKDSGKAIEHMERSSDIWSFGVILQNLILGKPTPEEISEVAS